MRQYELMMILDSSLSDSDRDLLVSEIETEIKATGATITSTDHPGERQLAYRIHGSKTGYYLLYSLERDGGDWTHVTNTFNIKTNIWRFMFSRIDE
ncbi:MAG: small subunit ribosomal protein [Patescibacteria group bacterium]|jgi:ribosomal protein S6|nr:small subunit ribosomal protein [Patescibacteria group bacterium]